MYPCLSFLTAETIVDALEMFETQAGDYATSVKPFKNWLFNGDGDPLSDINYRNLNTKDIEGSYQAAHCFHIFNVNQFLKTLLKSLIMLKYLYLELAYTTPNQKKYSILIRLEKLWKLIILEQ